jgi:ABC-2 type transport system permease protein
MLTLFRAEMKRNWAMIKAYPVDQIAMVVILAFLFYMLFLGTNYMSGGAHLGNRVDSIFVGYVAWMLMMTTYQSVSQSIRGESTQGTVMQLLTSPYSTRQILLTRAVTGALTDVVMITIVAGCIMLLTGIRLHLSIGIVPFLATALAAAAGLGFLLGAITLLYKKVDMVLSIVQYAILFGVMAPMEQWGAGGTALSVLVPVGPSAAGLRELLVAQHFSLVLLAVALGNVLLYLGGGLLLFGMAERRAKRLGLLGAF